MGKEQGVLVLKYSMNASLKITSLVIVFSALLFSYAYAENEVSEGYDENTEITIKGTIKDIGREMRGPLIVRLHAGAKDYQIITAPPWFIAREGIELTPGRSYEVTGSKYISGDGNLYIIASRLKDLSTGKISQLRDSSCKPLWRGRGMRRGTN
jgi:hypothetical protein